MQRRLKRTLTLVLLLAVTLLFLRLAMATPSGASISFNNTDFGPTISAATHTANRSTITTVRLNAKQQDQRWKGYVGNVTGTLSLDDASNNTIYDWTLTNIAGEVYASRSTLDFGTVTCADAGTIGTEETAANMTGTEVDSIGATFNSTNHTDTIVAGTTLSACNSTGLFVNDASQGQNDAADFQEFLMEDAGNNLAYVSIINDNTAGFDTRNFDFQMIVAESDRESTPFPYYFYIELDG